MRRSELLVVTSAVVLLGAGSSSGDASARRVCSPRGAHVVGVVERVRFYRVRGS